jgi:hypothetical protein
MSTQEAVEILSKLRELVSPELIKALSPAEGLEVKSHTFNSTEQEGHWKGKEFKERRFDPPDWAIEYIEPPKAPP